MSADIYIDAVSGNDANPGTSGSPKQTWAAGISAIVGGGPGSILHVLNTGPYTITSTTNLTGVVGTDFDAGFGAKIIGEDISGNPAIAEVQFANNTSAQTGVVIRGTSNYVIIEGLYFNRNPNTFNSINKRAIGLNDISAGPIRVRYCIDESRQSSDVSGHFVNDFETNGTQRIEVSYCILINPTTNGGVNLGNSPGRELEFHHNIVLFEDDVTPSNIVNLGIIDSADTDHSVHHNTLLYRTGRCNFIVSGDATADANAIKRCHSNIFAQFGVTVGTDRFMGGNVAATTPWDGTLDIGFNVFVDPGGLDWATAHPYQIPWDPDDLDDGPPETQTYYGSDTVDEGAGADPFNDKATPWTWEDVNGSGYDLPLTGDLRLIQYRTEGKAGSVPGAIEEAVNTAPIGVADSYNAVSNSTLEIVTPGVLGNDTDDDGDTLIAVLDVDVSFGNLILAADGSFDYVPNPDFIGTDTFQYHPFDGIEAGNTVTVTINVAPKPASIIRGVSLLGPSAPGKAEGDAVIRLRKNQDLKMEQEVREREVVTRAFVGEVNLSPLSGSISLPLGGLTTVRRLLLSGSHSFTIGLGGVPIIVEKGGAIWLFNVSTASFSVENTSPVNTVKLEYIATD